MAPSSSIASLPEEILVCIFQHLDTPPPSQVKIRQEPNLQLTSDSASHAYKDISCVTRRWRRIVLPLLFKFSRIYSTGQPRAADGICKHNGYENRRQRLDDVKKAGTQADPGHTMIGSIGEKSDEVPAMDSIHPDVRRPLQLQHCLENYLQFIQNNDLESSVQSFVFLTERILSARHGPFPHQYAEQQYLAAVDLWHQLYSVLRPLRVVIVAPPAEMACLTSCAIDTRGDWAFTDMDFHILELCLQGMNPIASAVRNISPAEAVPKGYPGVADASILNLQQWSHLSLNEGSFLKAYGTYEYFERGPPSLISSIKNCLTANTRGIRGNRVGRMPRLRSIKYTAILPFANHVDFRDLLCVLDELDIKLAPDLGFLTDMARVGKAQLEDCWQEFFTAYRLIVEPLRTFNIRPDGTPKLQRFVCRDMQITALQPDLDDEFIALCLPVWAEMEPGIYVRLQDSPPMYLLEE